MLLDGESAVSEKKPGVVVSAATAAGVGGVIVALLLAARLGALAAWGDGAYWAAGIGIAAVIALAAGLIGAGRAGPVLSGMSLVPSVVSGAFFVAIPGAVFALGYDGLSYALGIGAGCLLMQLLVAPRFAASGADSLPALLAMRFPGRMVVVVSGAIIAASMIVAATAGLMAAGLIGTRLLGIGFDAAVIAAACAVFACFIVRGEGDASIPNAMLYVLLLVALLVPLVIVSVQWFGLPVPQIAYANSLWQLQGIEEDLLGRDLADPAYMRPLMTAFLTMAPINFAGIVLALAAGVAALPNVLAAPLAQRPMREARHTALWVLGWCVLLLTLMPAAATYARQSIASLIADGATASDLPQWVFAYGKLGLVEVCERAATDAATVRAACSASPDASGALRLQDIAVNQDIVGFALPEIAGLDGGLTGLLAVAILAAVLVGLHAPINVVVRALGIDAAAGAEDGSRGTRIASYVIAATIIVAGAVLAMQRLAPIIDIATGSLAFVAAGLFPALVGALWWPRANAWGASAAMLAGAGFMLLYFAGQHYFAVPFVEATSALSSGGSNGLEYFTELKDAWLAAEPGAAKLAAWAALDAHARSMADWWGIGGAATVLLALPVGFVALVVVSLLTGDPRKGTSP